MKITEVTAAKRYRGPIQGYFQRTFQTPLDKLPAFVALLLAGDPPIVGASVTVEQAVFTPDHLEKLLIVHRLPLDYRDHAVVAETRQEASDLLVAALGGWLDFFFVPEPKRFILYADHDEYTTLFAPRKGALSTIGGSFIKAGFKELPDYVREF